MKTGAYILTYNCVDMIRKGLLGPLQYFDETCIIYSEQPIHGKRGYDDLTREALEAVAVRTNILMWQGGRPEEDIRNYALKFLYDKGCSYVMCIDEDELYTPDGISQIKAHLKKRPGTFGLRGDSIRTFWGSESKEVWERPKHTPVIVTSNGTFHTDRRCAPIDGVFSLNGTTMDHYSWVRPRYYLQEKLSCYSHALEVPPMWMDNVVIPGLVSDSGPFRFEGLRTIEGRENL